MYQEILPFLLNKYTLVVYKFRRFFTEVRFLPGKLSSFLMDGDHLCDDSNILDFKKV